MVKIKCLTGPHAGVVHIPPQDLEPAQVLMSMVNHGWQWEIDFSHASREETIVWGGADLMVRAIRAVQEGRGAFFMGEEYSSVDELQAFEDAIYYSGYLVQVVSDDEDGLRVVTVQPE